MIKKWINQIKMAEIRWSIQVGVHHSIRIVDHQSIILKEEGKGSILEDIKLKRKDSYQRK